MRGKYKKIDWDDIQATGSSPHAREIRQFKRVGVTKLRIIPACAGNTSIRTILTDIFEDHPRMRGKYKEKRNSAEPRAGSSPHAREILQIKSISAAHFRIIPACAGNTIKFKVPFVESQDHPRMRGKYFGSVLSASHRLGSSPHAREIQSLLRFFLSIYRIIPACAGNTPVQLSAIPELQDHPRMRGKYFFNVHAIAWIRGSSPHAREIQ